MPLTRLPLTDTRFLFRPVSTEFVAVLEQLQPDDWLRPTMAGTWRVRDVVAHVVDGMLRRVSFHRDGLTPPPPTGPLSSDREFVEFINDLNAQWVAVANRFSPRVLTTLLSTAGAELADFMERLPLDAPALFPVSWAGETSSEGWFDVGREFTELWHHQAQVRAAVGVDPLRDPRYLRAVLELAVRGLPHAYRHVMAAEGSTVALVVVGGSGGIWTLERESNRWTIREGAADTPDAHVSLSEDAAWRLLFNALSETEATRELRISGDRDLAMPLLASRSVIV
jgi:uncharacterized protein (TIGR03083 family)